MDRAEMMRELTAAEGYERNWVRGDITVRVRYVANGMFTNVEVRAGIALRYTRSHENSDLGMADFMTQVERVEEAYAFLTAPEETDEEPDLTASQLAEPLREAVRHHVEGGGEWRLTALVERAYRHTGLIERLTYLAERADRDISDANVATRLFVLKDLIADLQRAVVEFS